VSGDAVCLYTDGACSGNPGPGGYGVILVAGAHRKELSAGYRRTTNNRMEIMAVLAGLEALNGRRAVTVVTDSRYVCDAISAGWATRWRAKGWMRARNSPAMNWDLWERILALLESHTVTMEWVRGHAGHHENERCDVLSTTALRAPNLALDEAYESGLYARPPGAAGPGTGAPVRPG
jgi:ribonuclease HI